MINIAFLASHNGSSAKAITQACADGIIAARPALLISNNAAANALAWAKEAGLSTSVINASTAPDVDGAIANLLQDMDIQLVVCSGYMKLIGEKTIAAMRGKILNIHPALLPKYGGKGMYGRHVHQAVFDNQDKNTGITIHWVDGAYDHGAHAAQKIIPLPDGYNVDMVEQAVKDAEPAFYIETLQNLLKKPDLF